jgi:hypothetical protein
VLEVEEVGDAEGDEEERPAANQTIVVLDFLYSNAASHHGLK